MIIKIFSPILIVAGWGLYVLLDNDGGGAVRWPGVSLIILGILLIPVYHITTFKNGTPGISKPTSKPFKLSLVLLLLAALCFGAIFLYEGLGGLIWLIPSGIFALSGILVLFVSLYVQSRS